MGMLSRFPDWVTFSVAIVVAAAGLELVRGDSLASAIKSAAVGAIIIVPLLRFWLMPPPKDGRMPRAAAGKD
jgi:hypothetical protein